MAYTQNIEASITFFCVIFIFNQLSGSLSQRVTLYPFRQSDTNSTCTQGFIHQLDTVVFRCTVDYYESSPRNTLGSKIMKNGITVRHLIDYNLPKQCFFNSTFACRRFKDRILLDYNISVEAHVDLNGAVLQAAIYSENPQDFYSEEQSFPAIYDVKNTTGRLLVNGKEIFITNGSYCETETMGPHISVLYECRSSVTPCVIEISSTETENTYHGNNVAVYNTNSSESFDFSVTIKYGLCGLDQHSKTERCRIKVRVVSEASCVRDYCLVGFLTIVLFFFLEVIWRRRYSFLKHFMKVYAVVLHQTNNPENCEMFETECFEDGEESISEKMNTCKKCKNHNEKFLPLHSLNMDSMPAGYRCEDLLHLVKVTSDLTVRIFVSKPSNRQPLYLSDDVTRKKTFLKAGTGIISGVVKYKQNDKNNYISCNCPECKLSRNFKKVVGEIRVATAAQVVIDNSEVETTTCRISIEINNNFKTFDIVGYQKDDREDEENFSIFTCHTCQEDLLDHLWELRREWVDLFETVEAMLMSKEDGDTFSFMVSHPHGSDKVVSFGHWVHKTVDPGFTKRTKYTYTTPSCPGSSGAFVYVLDEYEHVHCGVTSGEINFSSTSNYSSFRSTLKKIHLDN